jgi:copper homeostasis protein
MASARIFEVCAFNIQSALVAEKAGAKRVELCDNPVEGGTTPGYGTIRRVREKITIDLYPILRPRSGNYFYEEDEFNILKDDIGICRELGCNGISVGIQEINAEIDTERLKRIVEWAGPMGVTCNRVFDSAPDPYQALEDIIDCGCERILTSGQAASAPAGAALLAELVRLAGDRIIIMPGAGIRSDNIAALIKKTGAREFHGSARKITDNPVSFINPAILDYGNVYVTDSAELKAILEQL